MEEAPPKTAAEHFNRSAENYEKYTGGCTREVAQYILSLPQLADAGAPGTVVLDNACGSALVAEEIILQRRRGQGQPGQASTATTATIHAVDAAPNMINVARRKIQDVLGDDASLSATTHVMPGEKLDFPSATFSHSITNLGILFFQDGLAGAREIHRTLRPGGVAVLTSWSDLGYIDPVVKAAQLEIRPGEPTYQLPLPPQWLLPSHLESVLNQAGFDGQVEMSARKAHYGAETVDGVVELLAHSFQAVAKDWSDDEKVRFRALMREKTERIVEEYTMPDGRPGVGIVMMATVAVCRK
ncbi:S-adenosyl-L-methionine-dependent methyltransferase [Parathielavia hyrcaniae]|uniref:S-adenosyl-L-methionine-dependent methyltransferase n=1 Tax=Parathielavia hyrcaniae TaxID=113614 RepID=A0AAN6PZ50_9PEZI|nr:S-adenosyl-L-methionine-dependent methyltransferase [Parathielavia hyrcaniae]